MRKALVPLIVAGILSGLAALGLSEDMTLSEALTFVVTAGLVWLVPNEQ